MKIENIDFSYVTIYKEEGRIYGENGGCGCCGSTEELKIDDIDAEIKAFEEAIVLLKKWRDSEA